MCGILETGRLSWGFVAHRLHLVSALVASGSLFSGLPQSSIPIRTPTFFYCKSLLQRWFRSAAGQWFAVYGYLLTLRLPSIETPHLYISEHLSAARGHNSTRTAIIFACIDSFIQALRAEHGMLTPLPVTCSHANDIHITDLVTASAAIILAGSFSRSCYHYLTLAV